MVSREIMPMKLVGVRYAAPAMSLTLHRIATRSQRDERCQPLGTAIHPYLQKTTA